MRLPYVGDDASGEDAREVLREKLRASPEKIKSFDHRCLVCGGDAPFGVDYPAKPRWFCRQHVGEAMPEVPQNLDKQRLVEVRRKAVRGAMLWLELLVAADNQDGEGCKQLWGRIRDVSIEASDILKALGKEKPNG